MKSDLEARVQRLETILGNLLNRLLKDEALIGLALSGLQQLRGNNGGGGGYSNITWVYTPAAGIPYATATAGPSSVLTQGSVMCYPGTDNGSGSWTASASATLLVYNGYTSATSHINAGVGGAWILVGTSPNGDTECIGDPCL